MYLLRYTLTLMDDNRIDEALELALKARVEGKGSAILTEEETRKMFPEMQDLTPFMEKSSFRKGQ